MASRKSNFSDSERAELASDIRTMLLYTENSGDTSSVNRFSAGSERSTHAFGIMQFDVGRNRDARDFLKSIGFTPDQIRELSRHGSLSDRIRLNAQLQAHATDLDRFTDLQIQISISRLDSLIDYLDRTSPSAATAIRNDHRLQLALVDYDNQLRIDGLGSTDPLPNTLLAYLSGRSVNLTGGALQLNPTATLTRNDIQNYIDNSRGAANAPIGTRHRAYELNKALNLISSGQNRLPHSVPPDRNKNPTSSGTRQIPAGHNTPNSYSGLAGIHNVLLDPYGFLQSGAQANLRPAEIYRPNGRGVTFRLCSTLPSDTPTGTFSPHGKPRLSRTGCLCSYERLRPTIFPFSPRPGNILAQPFEGLFGGAPPATSPPQQQPIAQPGPAKPFYSLKDKLAFLGEVYPTAKRASDATGLSLPFILAHAAHETGWGKNVSGNNLFNLKADGDWQGPAITKGHATYRAYPSYRGEHE